MSIVESPGDLLAEGAPFEGVGFGTVWIEKVASSSTELQPPDDAVGSAEVSDALVEETIGDAVAFSLPVTSPLASVCGVTEASLLECEAASEDTDDKVSLLIISVELLVEALEKSSSFFLYCRAICQQKVSLSTLMVALTSQTETPMMRARTRTTTTPSTIQRALVMKLFFFSGGPGTGYPPPPPPPPSPPPPETERRVLTGAE